ncbi:MAG: YwiC-like family protein [Fidelibacterota bacterium]
MKSLFQFFNPKPFPRPRQHGAWIMFLIPAFMAVFLDPRWVLPDIGLIFTFILIFLSYQPLQRFLRQFLKRSVFDYAALQWTLLLGGGGIILAATLFLYYQRWNSFLFGTIVLVLLLLHLMLAIQTNALALPAELVGVLGLTAAAPTIAVFNTGTLNTQSIMVWLVNALYFAGSIFYIKLKLRIQPAMPKPEIQKRIKLGLPLLFYTLFLYVLLFGITQVYPSLDLLIIVFLPFAFKSIVGVLSWYDKSLARPGRTGLLEILHVGIFTVLTIITFAHFT